MEYRIKYQNIVFVQGLNSREQCKEWIKNNLNKDNMIMISSYHAVSPLELVIEEYDVVESVFDMLEKGAFTLNGAFFRMLEEKGV